MPKLKSGSLEVNYLEFTRPDAGEGPQPCLVAVHGLAANLAFWYPMHQALLELAPRVILLDLRGHGRSSMPDQGYTPAAMAEDLVSVLDQLHLDEVHLLGHSFGGSVVLHLAQRHPQRVTSLTLADVRLRCFQPQQQLRNWHHWPQLKPRLAAAGFHLDEEYPESGYQLLEVLAQVQLSPQAAEELKTLRSPFKGRAGRQAAKQWLRLLEGTTARQDLLAPERFSPHQLQQLDLPLLAVYGEYSQALPTARQLEQLWPTAHFEIVPKAGHFFPLSHPQNLLAPMGQFFEQFGCSTASLGPTVASGVSALPPIGNFSLHSLPA